MLWLLKWCKSRCFLSQEWSVGLIFPTVAALSAAGISPTLHTRGQDLVSSDQARRTSSPFFRLFLPLYLFVRVFSPSFTRTKTSGCICRLHPSLESEHYGGKQNCEEGVKAAPPPPDVRRPLPKKMCSTSCKQLNATFNGQGGCSVAPTRGG